MQSEKCGVCNHEVPIDFTQIARKEEDGTYTFYHMYCEVPAAKLKPCVDCGHHKALCDECKEWEEN